MKRSRLDIPVARFDAFLRELADLTPDAASVHLDDDALLGYIDGTLAAAPKQAVQAHLSVCDACGTDAALLRQVLMRRRAAAQAAVPAHQRSARGRGLDAEVFMDAAKRLLDFLIPLSGIALRGAPAAAGDAPVADDRGPLRWFATRTDNGDLEIAFGSDDLAFDGYWVRLSAGAFLRDIELRASGKGKDRQVSGATAIAPDDIAREDAQAKLRATLLDPAKRPIGAS